MAYLMTEYISMIGTGLLNNWIPNDLVMVEYFAWLYSTYKFDIYGKNCVQTFLVLLLVW